VTAATAAALRAHAAGLYPAEAGIELLISHDCFLHRHDFAGFAHTGTSITDGTPVSLHDTIPGLDNPNLKLLITAIRHAAGQRPPHP
jgi:hypothetical protein